MIKVKNLSKSYDNIKAVDDLSFEIEKGEIVGFVGPNGAGKSTTLKLITGYAKPDKGEINISGLDIVKDNYEVKKKIGYLSEGSLYQNMKVIEFLNFIAEAREIKNKKQSIDKVIFKLNLEDRAYQTISNLSKGFKQRVGLAQAILHEPEVIILDEPTSGLDPNQVLEIRDIIKDIGKNKTVIFSTHLLSEVEVLCNKIILINKGKILYQGEEFKKSSFFLTLKGKDIIDKLSFLNYKFKVLNYQNEVLEIVISTNEDIREKLFNFAIEKDLIIIELYKKNQSLEVLFKNLTQGDKK